MCKTTVLCNMGLLEWRAAMVCVCTTHRVLEAQHNKVPRCQTTWLLDVLNAAVIPQQLLQPKGRDPIPGAKYDAQLWDISWRAGTQHLPDPIRPVGTPTELPQVHSKDTARLIVVVLSTSTGATACRFSPLSQLLPIMPGLLAACPV